MPENPSVPLDWSDRWICASLVCFVQADDRSIWVELVYIATLTGSTLV